MAQVAGHFVRMMWSKPLAQDRRHIAAINSKTRAAAALTSSSRPSFASGGLARHVQLVANLLIGRFGKCSWLCGRGPRPSDSNGGRRPPILFPTHLEFQARHQSLGILQIRRFEPFAELIVN